MKDLHHHLSPAVAIAPAVAAATATSAAIDLAGFNSAELIVQTGAIAGDGAFSVKLQHSDTTTGGDFVDVPASGVLGSTPATLAADSVYRLGYVGGTAGPKRYVRVVATKASGTSIGLSAVIVRGDPHLTPAD
ncbi:hypothetical protein [uncultured Brevundimonas sp.]|uniref:hypothetical protein n=1 Tax=uncultured Brevundimonas sp. TaxID=213418 RepID=UPI002632E296|nr:hypothetical protein [uncultured Brevundimonas sp.]